MKHLLDIQQLTEPEVRDLMRRAFYFKKNGVISKKSEETVMTLFYENSTRTRASFELAANRLGMTTVNLDLHCSSETKGERIEDTVQTLAAMGIRYCIIRHSKEGLPLTLSEKFGQNLHIINAGDGKHAHPSQALLDFMTIFEYKPEFKQLKIAIVGDILHSRVANSWLSMSQLMGVGDLVLIAPEQWQPHHLPYGRVTSSLKDGLSNADVILCLRVQHERMLPTEQFDLRAYCSEYALTSKTLSYAKKDAIIMHPGPINRGVEIDSEVADGPQSVILKQVENGVFMRMAILDRLN